MCLRAVAPLGRETSQGSAGIASVTAAFHTNLGITSIYLQGIDNTEINDTVHARRAPMIPVQSSLNI